MAVASKVQKQSEINALSVAMAEQRTKDDESKADAVYRIAEINIRNAGLAFRRRLGLPIGE